MFCQNLIKPVKLSSFRNLKYQHVMLPHVSSASFSYLYSFSRQNLKLFSRINKSRYVPSVNIRTSNKYFDSSKSVKDEVMPEVEDLSQPLVKLTFITHDGKEIHIKGRALSTVMQAAVNNKIPMPAACGGCCSCTTCHVYVEEGTHKFFPAPRTVEEDMLDGACLVQENSRLSCQLIIPANLENARFHLPYETVDATDNKKL